MEFNEIGEATTVTFDMEGLHAMALICKAAADSGVDGVCVEPYLAAFTAATLISRVHGDMDEPMRAHLAAIHARIKEGRR